MPSYNATFLISREIQEPNPFLAGNRTTMYQTATVEVTGADRHHQRYQRISGDVSGIEIELAPLGSAAPSPAMLYFQTDRPCDVHLGHASAVPLSGVQFLLLHGTVCGLFIDTGSLATMLLAEVVGGSSVAFTISQPLP